MLNQNLAGRLLKIIFGIYFIIALTATIIQISYEIIHEKDAIDEEISEVVEVFLPAISDSLWRFNNENAKEAVKGIYDTNAVVSAVLKTDSTFTFGSESDLPSNDVEKNKSKESYGLNRLFEYAFPIKYKEGTPDEQLLGSLFVYSSSNVVLRRSKYTVYVIVVSAIVKTLFLWIIFYVVIGRMIAKPLEGMSHKIRNLVSESGDLCLTDENLFEDGSDVLKREDELGLFAKAFAHLYQSLLADRRSLLDYQNKLEEKVEDRTFQLKGKINQIKGLVDSIPIGILTINESGLIDGEYAPSVEDLLKQTHLDNKSIFDVLFKHTPLDDDTIEQIRSAILASVGEDCVWFSFNSDKLPVSVVFQHGDRSHFYSLKWGPVVGADNQTVSKVLLCVTDDTELKELQAYQAEQDFESVALSEILSIGQNHLESFLSDSLSIFSDLCARTSESLMDRSQALGTLHALKGESRMLNLSFITNEIHQAETLIKELAPNDEEDVDASKGLLEKLNDTAECIRRYARIYEEKIKSRDSQALSVIKQISDLSEQACDKPLSENQLSSVLYQITHLSKQVGVETFEMLIDTISRMTGYLARASNIEVPNIHFDGIDKTIDSQERHIFATVLSQLVSNTTAHGLEQAGERVDKGKSAAGNIYIHLKESANEYELSYEDDGRGLDIEALEKKMRQDTHLDPQENFTLKEIADSIFLPDVSTAENVSLVSGRGFGMKVIADVLQVVGGRVELVVNDEDSFDRYLPVRFLVSIRKH